MSKNLPLKKLPKIVIFLPMAIFLEKIEIFGNVLV